VHSLTEGDLLVGAGQRSAIATLVERKFRLTILVPVPGDRSARSVGDALIGAFTQLPRRLRRTLTWDQGNEMFHHQRIEEHTGLNIYFADPHSPWQRGANETSTGCYGNTCRRGPTSTSGPPTNWKASPPS